MFRRFASVSRPTAVGAVAAGLLTATATIAYASSESTQAEKKPVGVFLWGDAARRLAPAPASDDGKIFGPARVPYFDNIKLRSLAVSPTVACAATSDGSLVEWSSPNGQRLIIKSNVRSAFLTSSGDRGVALVGKNRVVVWRPMIADDSEAVEASVSAKGVEQLEPSDLAPGQLLDIGNAKLGWFESIVSISAGDDHVAALTSRGRVLTALIRPLEHHDGQLGLASYPFFDPAPAPHQFHQVSLLPGPARQVVSGSHHVLALLRDGTLYGFGCNTFGQLAQPFSFRTSKISAPVQIESKADICDVAAGGDISYMRDASDKQFVFGNGQAGQHGTGSFAQCQTTPLRLKTLEHLVEYNEAKKQLVTFRPARWSVSKTHTFVQLTNHSQDILAWGQNIGGQLGNGRRSTAAKPIFTQRYGLFEKVVGDRVVAGDGISGCYTSV